MYMTLYPTLTRTATTIALLLALNACSSGQGEAASATDSGSDSAALKQAEAGPPIHVEQTVVLLRGGKPAIEQNYQQALSKCSGDAAVAVTPLSADEVSKLGHTYMHLWYQGKRMVVENDDW